MKKHRPLHFSYFFYYTFGWIVIVCGIAFSLLRSLNISVEWGLGFDSTAKIMTDFDFAMFLLGVIASVVLGRIFLIIAKMTIIRVKAEEEHLEQVRFLEKQRAVRAVIEANKERDKQGRMTKPPHKQKRGGMSNDMPSQD